MVTALDVEAARERLSGVVRNVPVEESARLSTRIGGRVWLAREDLQVVRSYKLRGAYNLIASLTDRSHGVVCASAGNHAQGVAYACSRLETDGAGDVLRSSRVEARSAYERIGRMLRSQHVAALPRDLFWNRWKLVIDTALAALASHQTALARDPADTLPLEVFTSELVDALTGMLLAPSSLRAAR